MLRCLSLLQVCKRSIHIKKMVLQEATATIKDHDVPSPSFRDVKEAYEVVKKHVHYTPMLTCSEIDKMCGRNVFMKAENFQKTGSFKIRGALNSVSALVEGDEVTKPKCIVTHSSGNHGQAVAKAAEVYDIPVYIIMPSDSPQIKKDAVRGYGGIVVECPPVEKQKIETADKVCKEKGGFFIHPSQSIKVLAGQGTIAIEMLEQNPDLDAIVAPVGGGGMISGIALAAKHLKPSIKVYAAEPEEANDCYLSKINGYITPLKHNPNTIADAVKSTIGKTVWPVIRDHVDDVITVSEEEIKLATKLVWERAKFVIEPTTGVGIAAVIGKKFATSNGVSDEMKNIGVVLCGGNVDIGKIAKIINGI